MTEFTFRIKSSDQAVTDHPQDEVARILEECARRVRLGAEYGVLHDVNGNQVGEFDLNIDNPREE